MKKILKRYLPPKLFSLLRSFYIYFLLWKEGKSKHFRFTRKLLKLIESPVVLVDVGASGGIPSEWFGMSKMIRLVAFDPDSRIRLSKEKDLHPDSIFIDCAVSEVRGEKDFYLTTHQTLSSLRKPNLNLLSRLSESRRNDFKIERIEKINVDTLDNLLGKGGAQLSYIDFLKIDVQGCSYEVLSGSNNILRSTIGMVIEVEFEEIYSNQFLFKDCDNLITGLDFSLFDIQKVYWKKEKDQKGYHSEFVRSKGQLTWANALYLRTPQQLPEGILQSNERIINTIVIYFVFG